MSCGCDVLDEMGTSCNWETLLPLGIDCLKRASTLFRISRGDSPRIGSIYGNKITSRRKAAKRQPWARLDLGLISASFYGSQDLRKLNLDLKFRGIRESGMFINLLCFTLESNCTV